MRQAAAAAAVNCHASAAAEPPPPPLSCGCGLLLLPQVDKVYSLRRQSKEEKEAQLAGRLASPALKSLMDDHARWLVLGLRRVPARVHVCAAPHYTMHCCTCVQTNTTCASCTPRRRSAAGRRSRGDSWRQPRWHGSMAQIPGCWNRCCGTTACRQCGLRLMGGWWAAGRRSSSQREQKTRRHRPACSTSPPFSVLPISFLKTLL